LYEDLKQPNKFRMEVVVPSWKQHLLQRERMTKNEKDVFLKLRNLRTDPNPPEEWVSLSVEKEVLNRRVRTGDYHQLTSINKPEGGRQCHWQSSTQMKQEATLTPARLKAPRAAAIAGIFFAVLLIAGLGLFRLSVQADPLETGAWLKPKSRS
jgi:hypothetical protein